MALVASADVAETARRISFDTHTHLFSVSDPIAAVVRHRPQYDATAHALIENLDGFGLQGAAVVQVSFHGDDNSVLASDLADHAARFRGVATLPPDITDTQLSTLHSLGVRGHRFNLIGRDPALPLGADYAELTERIRDREWHIEVHSPSATLAPLLDHWCRLDVRVVVDHFGRPEAERPEDDAGFQGLLARAGNPNIFVKMSAPYRLPTFNPAAFARSLLTTFPHDQLLWGSDWPWTQNEELHTYAGCLAWLHDWCGHDVTILDQMANAARTVYGFKGA